MKHDIIITTLVSHLTVTSPSLQS